MPAYNDIQTASLRDKIERSQCDFMVGKNQGINVCVCGVFSVGVSNR